MAHLTLAGLSADKRRLLLVDAAGAEFTLVIDAPLRAAVRGDPARIGQLEIKMESALRPRDIQARIRSGESVEAVAAAAQTTVEAIMAFAAPVLAERAHLADRAQRASVRRKSGETGARTLGEAVTEQLRTENLPAETVEWDAWRREDGRWTLAGEYGSPRRSGGARFAFDPPGNFVVAENDDARWLVGELRPAAAPRDDLRSARKRRLASVAAEELPLGDGDELGDDALELVAEALTEATTEDLTEPVARVREAHPTEDTLGAEPPAEAFLDRVFADQNPAPAAGSARPVEPPVEPLVDGAAAVDAPDAGDATTTPEPPHRREVKKSRGRASVPSWDEIMFGGKQD